MMVDQTSIEVSEQTLVDPDASATLDGQSPSELWSDILEGSGPELLAPLQEAVRTCLADVHHSARIQRLEEAGVTAEHGALAAALTNLTLNPQHSQYERAVATLDSIGAPEPSPLGWQLPLDVASNVCTVLDEIESRPVLEITVTKEFRKQRHGQRRRIIEFLVSLSQNVDIRLTGSRIELRWLVKNHRGLLPASVTKWCNTQREGVGVGAYVQQARSELEYDSRAVAILRELVDDPSQTRTYDQIEATQQVSRSYVRRIVTENLVPLNLVERIDHYGKSAVSLLPAGERLIDRIDAEIGRQQELSDCVTDTPNSSDNSRVSTREVEGGDGEVHPSTPSPPADTTPDRTSDRLGETHRTVYTDRATHAAAVGAATDTDIALVDAPVAPLDDVGTRLWSYDSDHDELIVGAEYMNPMQYQTCIALACADWRTFDKVLDANRLETVLDSYAESELRDSRNLGGLPEGAFDDPDIFRDRLEEWRDELVEMTTRWRNGDYDDASRFRSEITRTAHGLAGTMVHLLDLAGVDVVRLLQVPQFTRDFSTFREDDRREALVKTVVTMLAIQSEYQGHTAYRQLFELREGKREQALDVDVDAANPYGSVIGSVTIVGPGVSALENELIASGHGTGDNEYGGRLTTAGLTVHEDAPEFAIPVTVRSDPPREAYTRVVQRILSQKNLCPTREATAVLQTLTGNIWDVANACAALSPEASREIGLDELRYAISTLPATQILPDHPDSVGEIISVLLSADRPLSQPEIADRAGISLATASSHIELLATLDLVGSQDGGLRIALPWRHERHKFEQIVPEYIRTTKPVAAAIYELAEQKNDALIAQLNDFEKGGQAIAWPPDFEQLTDAVPSLRPWVPILRSACGTPSTAAKEALLGPRPAQQPVGEYQTDNERLC